MARLLAVCHSRLVMVDLSLPLYQRMGCTTKDRAARLSHAAQALPLSESALRSLSSVAVPSAQTQWSLPDLSYFRQFVVLTSGSTSQADELALDLKVSRSRLFEFALENFIQECQDRRLFEQINRACENVPQDETEQRYLRQSLRLYRRLVKGNW